MNHSPHTEQSISEDFDIEYLYNHLDCDQIIWLNKLMSKMGPQYQYLILVWFRGVWSPSCKQFMREWNTSLERIHKELNAVVVGITAQLDSDASPDWKLDYGVHVDAECSLSKLFRNPIVQRTGYLYGMNLPSIVILKRGSLRLTDKNHATSSDTTLNVSSHMNNILESEVVYRWNQMKKMSKRRKPVVDDILLWLKQLQLTNEEQNEQTESIRIKKRFLSPRNLATFRHRSTLSQYFVHCLVDSHRKNNSTTQ